MQHNTPLPSDHQCLTRFLLNVFSLPLSWQPHYSRPLPAERLKYKRNLKMCLFFPLFRFIYLFYSLFFCFTSFSTTLFFPSLWLFPFFLPFFKFFFMLLLFVHPFWLLSHCTFFLSSVVFPLISFFHTPITPISLGFVSNSFVSLFLPSLFVSSFIPHILFVPSLTPSLVHLLSPSYSVFSFISLHSLSFFLFSPSPPPFSFFFLHPPSVFVYFLNPFFHYLFIPPFLSFFLTKQVISQHTKIFLLIKSFFFNFLSFLFFLLSFFTSSSVVSPWPVLFLLPFALFLLPLASNSTMHKVISPKMNLKQHNGNHK